MEHSVKGVLSYFAIFVAIFVVVWIVQYLIWKIRISKIKEGIQKKHVLCFRALWSRCYCWWNRFFLQDVLSLCPFSCF